MKSYLIGMIFIAFPVSYFGFMLVVLSTHSGGVLLALALCLAPGVWVGEQIVGTSNNEFWGIFTIVQLLYWSVIIILFNKRRHSNAHHI